MGNINIQWYYTNPLDTFGGKIPALCDNGFPVVKQRINDILQRKNPKKKERPYIKGISKEKRKLWNKKYPPSRKDSITLKQKELALTDRLFSEEHKDTIIFIENSPFV